MNGLFTVVDGKIHLHPQAIQFIPTVSQLLDEEKKYLFAVYDMIDSPIKGQPISRRRELAVSFFFPKEEDKKKKIEELEADAMFRSAIEELKSVTYDPDRTTYDTYNEKLWQLNIALRDCDPKSAKLLLDTIDMFQERADKLKQKMEKEDVAKINVVLKGGRQLSYLEVWQLSKQNYKAANGRANA
jgi:hypothetical protein